MILHFTRLPLPGTIMTCCVSLCQKCQKKGKSKQRTFFFRKRSKIKGKWYTETLFLYDIDKFTVKLIIVWLLYLNYCSLTVLARPFRFIQIQIPTLKAAWECFCATINDEIMRVLKLQHQTEINFRSTLQTLCLQDCVWQVNTFGFGCDVYSSFSLKKQNHTDWANHVHQHLI